MALAPVTSRLRSLCLPIPTAGITTGRVPYLTMSRGPLVDLVGLARVRCQTVAATVHCRYTSDDKDDGEEAEDQDVEHDPLDHGPLEFSRLPPTRWTGLPTVSMADSPHNRELAERALRFCPAETFVAARMRAQLRNRRGPRQPKRDGSEPQFELLRLWRSPRLCEHQAP